MSDARVRKVAGKHHPRALCSHTRSDAVVPEEPKLAILGTGFIVLDLPGTLLSGFKMFRHWVRHWVKVFRLTAAREQCQVNKGLNSPFPFLLKLVTDLPRDSLLCLPALVSRVWRACWNDP